MSFLDAYEGSSGPARDNARRETGQEECSVVASSVFQFTTNLTSYKRMVDALGTTKDSQQHRIRMHKLKDSMQHLAKDTSGRLKVVNNLNAAGALSNAVNGTHKRLLKEFGSLMKEYQNTQMTCNEREQLYPLKENSVDMLPVVSAPRIARDAQNAQDLESASMGMSSTQEEKLQLLDRGRNDSIVRLDNELSYNESLIDERERDIMDIQDDLQEVNEIFQDLAVLVNEQGGMLEDIESNIVKTSVTTKGATQQLKQAEKSQKNSRCWICFLLVIVVVILLVLIVVLTQL